MDEELLAEFLTESNENLASIEEQLMELEENPENVELLDAIFRVIHTVKGSCGFLGLNGLEKVAHAGENLLGKIRALKFQVSGDLVSLLLECADAIKDLLAGLEADGAEPILDHTSIINRLHAAERLVESISGGAQAAAPAPKAPVAAATPDPQEKALASLKKWAGDYDDEVLQALAAEGLATPDEVVSKGFASLRAMDEIGPAVALKLLGAAKIAAKAGGAASVESATDPKDGIQAVKKKEPEATETIEVKPKTEAPKVEARAEQLPTKVEVKGGAGAPKAKSAPKQKSAGSIRVDVEVLDKLMNQVGELVLTRNRLVQMVNTSGSMEFMRVGRDVDQITEQLQSQLLRTRMQPIQTIWNSVPRIVRDIGKQLDKKIRVVMEGEETELDRTILNALKDPLTHIIRNSCDHGIERPGVRRESGKPEEGTLRLTASQEAGFIIIKIIDDGAGIDAARIKTKAVSMGVLTEEQAEIMPDKAALQLIFHAGLSTAQEVTNFSGRGVGMDVVRTSIEKVGGNVEINSEIGSGTNLRIKIPLTLAIISAMIVGCKGNRFAVPQMSVQELLSAPENSEEWRVIAGQPFFKLRGKLLPILSLNEALSLSDDEEKSHGSIVVVDSGDRTFGVLVDEIYGAEEIVVKPLGVHFQHLNFYGGCSILGDGRVIPIFDCNGLAQMMQMSKEAEAIQMQADVEDEDHRHEMQHTLIFGHAGHRYAIPMALVERLERLDASKIETSGQGEVLQYRGEVITVMRWGTLLDLENEKQEGDIYCLILSDGKKRLCLQVDLVVDILEVDLEIKRASESEL
ncbi:MAG: chemotaxis protein CheW, partial [Mariprofundaceae bacterium]